MDNLQTDRRNYGIDLLRIISMFMVVILHVLGQGGILAKVQAGNKFAVSMFMEIGAYCAVDIYALISGFVGFSEKEKAHKYSRYVILWMQVVFYCMLITTLFYVYAPDIIGKSKFVNAILPVSCEQYWYFSAYTGVFIFIPWLNMMVRSVSKKEMCKFIFGCLFVFSFYATVIRDIGDPFNLEKGYSFLWLTVLYIIGACIRKYEMIKYVEKKYLVLTAIGLVIFTWGWKLEIGNMFISYNSPTILGVALALLLLFAQVRVAGFIKSCVKFAAPAAFGVYLLHTHPLVFEYIIRERFLNIANLEVWMIPIAVLAVTAVIFIICIFIDKLRAFIFSILKLEQLAIKIEVCCRKVVDK